MQKYYQNKPKFNCAYSKSDLPKIKDGAYVINLDEFKSIGTDWRALYVSGNNRRASYDAIYFDSFGIEHVSKEIQKIYNKSINTITNIYRIQAYRLIMCGWFWIGFIDFLLKSKGLLDYTNWWNNTKIFSITKKMEKLYCVICDKCRKFEKPKISYLLEKKKFFLVFALSARLKVKNYLKKNNQLKY